jgi:hypothetical protein
MRRSVSLNNRSGCRAKGIVRNITSTVAVSSSFERVQVLAATFKANEERYLSNEYQEAEGEDFIDKFLTALGWDEIPVDLPRVGLPMRFR